MTQQLQKILFLSSLLVSAPSWACELRQMINVGGHIGFNTEGNVQVRENDVLGDDLHLKDELGMDRFWSLNLTYGICLWEDWLDISYSKYVITGTSTTATGFNFNGALYAPGKTDIKKTDYRRLSILYRHTLEGSRNSLSYSSWGAGVLLETLKFHINGTLSPSTTRFEKFEAFDRQLVPVPTISYTWTQAWRDQWGYTLDLQFSYLPKFKTPYTEVGNIFFEQYNFDGKVGVLKAFENNIFLEAGLHNKFFRQKGYSEEDTNEFSINSTGLYFDWRNFF